MHMRKFFRATANPVIAKLQLIEDGIANRNHAVLRLLVNTDAALPLGSPYKISAQQLHEKMIDAAKRFDAFATLILCKNDYRKAALYFYEIQQQNYSEKHILTLLRFSPLEVVDNLVVAFQPTNATGTRIRHLLNAHYSKARKKFCTLAPYFARYSTEKQLIYLSSAYKNSDFRNLITGCEQDLHYAKKRYELTTSLLEKLKNNRFLAPSNQSNFAKLPPAYLSDSRCAAALLEEISAWTYDNQRNAATQASFKTIRATNDWSTPMVDRYQWAEPITEVVAKHSKAPDIDREGDAYWLYYLQGCWLINVTQVSPTTLKRWWHGLVAVDVCWPKIEEILDEILRMEFRISSAERLARRDKEQLTQFYYRTAELVWHIGNTTPMSRGSGTYAEIMFALVHRYHGFQPPMLKLDFPQLDVLNITFPLTDYVQLFPYFFEPLTIPEHLRNTDLTLATLSPSQQIARLYGTLTPEKTGIKEYCQHVNLYKVANKLGNLVFAASFSTDREKLYNLAIEVNKILDGDPLPPWNPKQTPYEILTVAKIFEKAVIMTSILDPIAPNLCNNGTTVITFNYLCKVKETLCDGAVRIPFLSLTEFESCKALTRQSQIQGVALAKKLCQDFENVLEQSKSISQSNAIRKRKTNRFENGEPVFKNTRMRRH